MHCRLLHLYTTYSEVGLYGNFFWPLFFVNAFVCIEINNGTVRLIVRWLCYADRTADCFNQTKQYAVNTLRQIFFSRYSAHRSYPTDKSRM